MEEDVNELQQKLTKLQSKIQRHRDALKTGDAIKTAFVLPFISLLGYDALDPDQTVVGYPADSKSKMDYALRDEYEIRIGIHVNPKPDDMSHDRAKDFIETFNSSEALVAIVTNGANINIHGTDENGHYLETPLITYDLSAIRPADAAGLEHLSPESFSLNAFRSSAITLRLRDQLVTAIEAALQTPTEALATAVLANIEDSNAIEPEALLGMISDIAPNFRYTAGGATPAREDEKGESDVPARPTMTEEETLAFHIIKAIGAKHAKPDRIFARPHTSYVAVLLDDNNRNPIARIHYKAQSVKKIGFFSGENAEDRVQISDTSEIYAMASRIESRIKELTAPGE